MKKMIAAIVCAVVCSAALAAKDALAVLPFTGVSGEEGETIAELFSFSKELNEVFVPIPRTSIARAISSEQKFQTGSGMTDPDTIASIGKQLGAKYVVAGNIARLGNRNLLIISILKIDDLQQIAGDIQTYMRIEEIQDKLPDMARNIIAAIEIDSSRLDKLALLPVSLAGGNIDPHIADTLAQILSVNIIKSGKYAVYPRTATLEQVQTEYSNQLSGITADESVVDIGKADNPRLVLSVAARQLGNQNMFNASIINLESGAQQVGRSENYNTLNDGIIVMEHLARELTGVSTLGQGVPPNSREMAEAETAAPGSARNASDKPEPSAAPKPASVGKALGYGLLNLAAGAGSWLQGDWSGGLTLLAGYGAAFGLIAWELSLDYEDELAGIPGTLGLGIAGLTALYGFIRPFMFDKNSRLAELMERVDIALISRQNQYPMLRLSYTVQL